MPEETSKIPQFEGHTRLRNLQSPERAARNKTMTLVQKMYVSTPRDADLEEAIEGLIDTSIRRGNAAEAGPDHMVGRLAEERCLFLLGPSGSGKTRSLERVLLKSQEFQNYKVKGAECILITVHVPSPFTLRQFAQDLAAAAGFETTEILKENKAWSLARGLLTNRVLFIHVDEAQKLLETSNPIEIRKAVNAIRGLMQSPTWPVGLILSGTKKAAGLVADFQIGRRKNVIVFKEFSLPDDSEMLRLAMASFCEKAGIETGGVLDVDETLERLAHASLHRLGVTIEFMQDAIDHALREGKPMVKIDHFAKAYRRRTACEAEQNVLTMKHWRAVDPEPLLFPDDVSGNAGAESHKPQRERREE